MVSRQLTEVPVEFHYGVFTFGFIGLSLPLVSVKLTEREPSAHSPVNEEEDYDGEEVEGREGDEDEYNEGEGENRGECEGEDDEDEGEGDEKASEGRSLGSSGDGHTRPFILLTIWTVNNFKPTMTTKIFKNLWDRQKEKTKGRMTVHLRKEQSSLWVTNNQRSRRLPNIAMELVETAKVDAIAQFKASQPFIDACAVYYNDGFEDCMKQVWFVYPNLDLSKVTLDNPLLTTPAGDDTASEETDDSIDIEQGSKDDGVVLAQPTQENPVTPLIPSAEDPPFKDAGDLFAQDAQNPPTKDDENPPAQGTQNLPA
ncbi:hypothetical protein SO802_020811 [Lithocarpus litseifolius]|uniref:Uncharacterized protein n=1 Tax=Lithocarpus litseifolius TaxID=425828 RepID=A0AAW2CCY7_9ROSI